jgi:membrane associated rhomboid family serine protease
MSIKTDLYRSFKNGGALTRLIYINLGVYLLVNLVIVICRLAQINDSFITSLFALPASVGNLAFHPWTLVSYMFYHESFLHVLFNILTLYWFGKLFLLYFNQKQLVGLYLLGGLVGGLFYMLIFNLFPYFHGMVNDGLLIGASASALAIIMGIAAYVPTMQIHLFLIGKIQIRYLAAVIFFLSLFSVVGDNPAGNLAHLGGLGFGYLFAMMMKKGKDLTKGLNSMIDFFVDLFTRKPKMKVTKGNHPLTDQEWNYQKNQATQELDTILEKIKRAGYESLTAEEKKKLFEQSNRM